MVAYMRALKPGGILSVTLWNKEEPPKSVLKLYATMAAAARDVAGGQGGGNIADKFYVASSYLSTATVLYKRDGFTAEDIAKLNAHTKAMSFDEIYAPGLKVDESELAQILQDYRDQFFFEGEPPDPTAPSEKEPNDKPPPGMTPAASGADVAKDVAPPPPRIPATVLGRIAWQQLVNGGWQKVAGEYVFETRMLANHQPYFGAVIKLTDLLKFPCRRGRVQSTWCYCLIVTRSGSEMLFA